ncbi:MAG: hypothetical protein HYY78_12590 [Betaproteobacteria bacterium]|nr:hypothetical protein [Betaproteobacteria bacterium]
MGTLASVPVAAVRYGLHLSASGIVPEVTPAIMRANKLDAAKAFVSERVA